MAKEKMPQAIPWKCPQCKVDHEGCDFLSEEVKAKCAAHHGCMGFICECVDDGENPDHGQHLGDPCPDARCYHCGWAGTFPQIPKKMPTWAKKAMEQGWRPPVGWIP